MKKLIKLRDALTTTNKNFITNPDTLKIYVTKGQINALGPDEAFENEYEVLIFIENFTPDSNLIFVPLLAFLSENQSSAFDDGKPFEYDIEILDNANIDIAITLNLTEVFEIKPVTGGKIIESLPEIALVNEEAAPFIDYTIDETLNV